MSEPPSKKARIDAEAINNTEPVVDEDHEENNEFGLNSSDLEDLLADSDTDGENVQGNDSDDINDPEIKEYVEKYPKLRKQEDLKTCVEFIKLLETAKIDPFSSYDLDINTIISDPNYIIKSCNNLDEIVRRDLWDEYCKNVYVKEESDESAFPEVQFVKFIKQFANDNKFPKFYTDFNRIALRKEKSKGESVYSDLCKVVSKEKRQEIFNIAKEFTQIDDPEKVDYCLKKLSKLKQEGDILDFIKENKIVDGYIIYLLSEDQLKDLLDRMYTE